MPGMANIFSEIPADLPEELFETLAQSGQVHIERIVSRGQVTAAGEWYDQALNEFVLLLQGGARLEFLNGETFGLGPGDWCVIPAHRKHRVAWTDEERDTVWLAVHYPGD